MDEGRIGAGGIVSHAISEWHEKLDTVKKVRDGIYIPPSGYQKIVNIYTDPSDGSLIVVSEE